MCESFFNNLLAVVNKTLTQLQEIEQFELSSYIKDRLLSLLGNNQQLIIEIIEIIFTRLLKQIQSLMGKLSLNIQLKDYQQLQKALQKAQQQNRNHIRAQQILKLYNETLEEKGYQFNKQIQQLKNSIQFCEEKLEQYSIQNVKMRRKIQFYEEKMYEAKRQLNQSGQKNSQNSKLLNKNSLHFKQKSKAQPNNRNYSISRPIISKAKEKIKQKASLIMNFENLFVNSHGLSQDNSLDHIRYRKDNQQINNRKEHAINYQQLKCQMQLNSVTRKKVKHSKITTEGQEERGQKYSSIGL